ncbi:tyrosine-type recombinase/integrase [Bacillus sp. BAU-SS-2023]|nr:tyrosine-type recombinase/integrase [Bacillus sp. BAU-SS-2023]
MKGSVRKRDSGKWEYYFDMGIIDGKRKKKTKGGFKTKSEATKALREAISLYEQGLVADNKVPYYSDYLDYFYDNYIMLNTKYSTQYLYKKIIEVHIKKDLGFYKLNKLNSSILQNYLNKKYNEGYSKNYLISIKNLLNMSLRHACKVNKYIPYNPVSDVSVNFKFNNKHMEIIYIDDFKCIINDIRHKDYYYIPLSIGFYTGMRCGEILALKWDNVDLENGIIHVKYTLTTKPSGEYFLTDPKTKNSIRSIYIGETLCNILKNYKDRQLSEYGYKEFVCCSIKGNVMTRKNIGYLNKYIKNNLNIKFNFHMLRHLHATLLLESGANIKSISERLGHSSTQITLDTYTHNTLKLEKETVDLFERYTV